MDDMQRALAALANDLNELPETKEKKAGSGTQTFSLFSTSVLICYLQGAASPLFMQATENDFENALDKTSEEIKTFLKPLFLILHNNKNIKFRPVNKHMLSPTGLETFERFIVSFRKETRLEAFLENYKNFLLFLAKESIPIKDDKVFTDLENLLIRIADYRINCTAQETTANNKTLTAIDITSLKF